MRRARWVALVLVVVAAVTAGGVAWFVRDRGASAAERRAQATHYADALRPILTDGGRVIVLGIKPALTDYTLGKNHPGVLEQESAAWDTALAAIEDRVEAVVAPEFLAAAKAKYLAALARYRELARRIGAAAAVPKDQRSAVVKEVATIGDEADRIYDEAEALVNEATAEE